VTAPLAHLAPARRRLLFLLVAVLAVGVLAVAGWLVLRPGAAEVAQSEPGPVVLVPGYGGRVESLDPLVAALQEQGRETRVLEPTDGGTGDLGAQAARLGDLVEATLAETDAASVDLVGYSAGGVVARLYVREEGGADVVRRVLTIGSPHHGSDAAALALQAAGSCPVACEQLAPDSDLLRRLNAGDETPAGPLWATVRSDADTVVTPTESALLEGAVNVRVQALCDAATSHGELPGDPVTEGLLESALGTAAPETPSDVRC
jgi:triacylglycerol lipase